MKRSINPMHKAHAAPRCTAKSKRSGLDCQAPAVAGHNVCRMHGARGGGPTGKQNGRYVSGHRSQEAASVRESLRALLKHCRAGMAEINQ